MEPRRKFRFLKELSEGNFGKVYMAEMITGESFSSVVAIKLLHGKWLGHDEIVQRSRDEARVLGLLHHRNIVRVEDLTSINGQCAVVMEYLEGVDIKNLVQYCTESSQRFPRKLAFDITAAIASALEAAYYKTPLQGGQPLQVIHRDIKPSNVMVTVSGDIKVLDFGTAQARFEEREAKTQALAFGSAAYMGPERLLGDPDAPSGDIFSLGITLYEMLSHDQFGKVHIRPERYEAHLDERVGSIDLSDVSPDTAEQVRATLKVLLAYDSSERPDARQVGELMEALSDEVHDGNMRRFCRTVVDPARAALAYVPSGDDPLTGSTLFEDRSGVYSDVSSEVASPVSGTGTGSWLNSTAPPSVGDANGEVFEDEGEDPFQVPPELQDDAPAFIDAPVTPAPTEGPAAVDDNWQAEPDSGPTPAFRDDVASPGRPDAVEGPVAPVAPPPAAPPAVGYQPPPATRPSVPIAANIPFEDEPAPAKSGGAMKFVIAGVLFLLLLGGGGAAVVAVVASGAGGGDKPTVEPTPDVPVAAASSGKPGGRVEVGAVEGENGVLKLKLEPAGGVDVSLSHPAGFKFDWDGSGELELVGVPQGTYKAKISTGGKTVRNTLAVEAGKTCTFNFKVAGGEEWERISCE
jgi:eukaryotic-like serine/threonine-protein kinase